MCLIILNPAPVTFAVEVHYCVRIHMVRARACACVCIKVAVADGGLRCLDLRLGILTLDIKICLIVFYFLFSSSK